MSIRRTIHSSRRGFPRRALRGIAPGLKQYTLDDALAYCLESEQRMGSPPSPFSVTNRKIIGLVHLKKEEKEQVDPP